MLMEILHNLQYDPVFFRNNNDPDPLCQSIPAAAWFVLVSTCITSHFLLSLILDWSHYHRRLRWDYSSLISRTTYHSSYPRLRSASHHSPKLRARPGIQSCLGEDDQRLCMHLCCTQSIYLLTFLLGTRRLEPRLSGTHIHSRSYRSTSRLPPHAWTRSLQPQIGAKPDWT